VVAFLALITISRTYRLIGTHQHGLIHRLGRYHHSVGPGTVILVPFIEDLVLVDMRERRAELRDNRPGGRRGAARLQRRSPLPDRRPDQGVRGSGHVRGVRALGGEALRRAIESEPVERALASQRQLAATAQSRLAGVSGAVGPADHLARATFDSACDGRSHNDVAIRTLRASTHP
jgi:regulator of protease activity HflC (stomatin/prohibitin superfamily)